MELDRTALTKEAESAANIRVALDKALLERIEQLDNRVRTLEVQHDKDMETIRQLTVKAAENHHEIERLTAENLRLLEQLKCPVTVCPFVNEPSPTKTESPTQDASKKGN